MGLVSIAVVDNMPFEYAFLALADCAGNFLKVHFVGIAIKSSKMQVIKVFPSLLWLETPY